MIKLTKNQEQEINTFINNFKSCNKSNNETTISYLSGVNDATYSLLQNILENRIKWDV